LPKLEPNQAPVTPAAAYIPPHRHFTEPALSQQLAELRRAGLVETRRAAKQVFSRLAGRDVLLCVKGVEAMADREGDLATALADILAEPETKSGLGRKSSGAASFAKLL
jgi:DNA-binding transcriptional ArsR family regulator